MGDKSAIEWTDATWNVTYGCTRVSRGCDNCYAVRVTQRLAGTHRSAVGLVGKGHFNGKIQLLPERLEQPLRWRRPRRIFVNSLSDLFHPNVPFGYVDRVFAVMALADHHIFQILTKRPERMAAYFAYNPSATRQLNMGTLERVAREAGRIAEARGENTKDLWWDAWLEDWPLRHIWLGTSVEDQEAADARIPHLLRVPAKVRFLSCEPLLGPVDIAAETYWDDPAAGLHWVIGGGESGPGHRPCDPAWARQLRDQCTGGGVAFFWKQWGGRTPKAGGRELDGRTWDEYPGRRAA